VRKKAALMNARSKVMEQFVRILTAIFWVAAPLFVASLVVAWLSYDFVVGLLSDEGLEVVNAVLIGTVAACSGLIAWYEFRANPAEEAEYGEWTGKMAFYAMVFGITLFLSFFFVPVVFFGS
jgi:hypothetical protein